VAETQTRQRVLVEDAHRFARLTERKRGLHAELRDVEGELAQVESNLIEGMVAAGMQNMTIGGFNLYLYNRLSVRAKDGDHARLAQALFDCGREDLIIIGPQRLAAEVREEEDAEALPPEIREAVTVERIPKVGARKAK